MPETTVGCLAISIMSLLLYFNWLRFFLCWPWHSVLPALVTKADLRQALGCAPYKTTQQCRANSDYGLYLQKWPGRNSPCRHHCRPLPSEWQHFHLREPPHYINLCLGDEHIGCCPRKKKTDTIMCYVCLHVHTMSQR